MEKQQASYVNAVRKEQWKVMHCEKCKKLLLLRPFCAPKSKTICVKYCLNCKRLTYFEMTGITTIERKRIKKIKHAYKDENGNGENDEYEYEYIYTFPSTKIIKIFSGCQME